MFEALPFVLVGVMSAVLVTGLVLHERSVNFALCEGKCPSFVPLYIYAFLLIQAVVALIGALFNQLFVVLWFAALFLRAVGIVFGVYVISAICLIVDVLAMIVHLYTQRTLNKI